jgi:hypothetical protein
VKVEGDVVDDAGAAAKAGQVIASGHGLEVRKGSAVVALKDETHVELRADTKLDKVLLSADQKKFQFSRGVAVATVTRQQPKTSILFLTPHTELTVLGTKLLFEIGKESTRVEVHEGRVRGKRIPDGAITEIPAGRFVTMGGRLPLMVKPIPTVRCSRTAWLPTPDYKGHRGHDDLVRGPDRELRKIEAASVSSGFGGQQSALIRWDVSSIPAGSRVCRRR